MNKDVINAINGDKEAFVALIKLIRKDLYKVAKGFFENEEDVKDAIGHTIMRSYEKIDSLKEPKYFKTWIIRILINNCTDMLNKKNKLIILEKYNETSYIPKEKDFDLHKAINILPKEIRQVIILYYFHDNSLDKISKILEIKKGTVKSRLFRGREKLHSILTKGDVTYENYIR